MSALELVSKSWSNLTLSLSERLFQFSIIWHHKNDKKQWNKKYANELKFWDGGKIDFFDFLSLRPVLLTIDYR